MTSVGIRELRQRASDLLRLVEAGETVEITDRGRPVALLTPIPDDEDDPLADLRRRGELIPATEHGDIPMPTLTWEGELPSQVLARLREHER